MIFFFFTSYQCDTRRRGLTLRCVGGFFWKMFRAADFEISKMVGFSELDFKWLLLLKKIIFKN